MKRLLDERHRLSPFDVLIIFNLKAPQIAGKRFGEQRGIPVILEYEDDAFRDEVANNFVTVRNYQERTYRQVLSSVSACVAVSPFLLSQVPRTVPQLLLRGVVGEDVIKASERFRQKKNIVLFSGTHNKINGAEELITAWRAADLSGWELHITGYGDLTDSLRKMAEDCPAIVFHGLVSRADLVELMGNARVCISPEQLSPKPGERFPFKVIEYLAAGAHVVMTAMGNLEREIEEGITYMADNKPETIVSTLRRVIGEERYTRTAERIVQMRYGPNAISESLDGLLTEVAGRRGSAVAGSAAYREA
jgi:glycosyltransferase involved in cell wall biosynthesis